MTDRQELTALIAKAREAGAIVVPRMTGDGQHFFTIRVLNLKGVGPCPMSPIAFAERMREVLR